MAKKAIPVKHRTSKNSIAAKRSKKVVKRPLSQTLQRAISDPQSVPHDEMLELQSSVGNDVMRKTLSGENNSNSSPAETRSTPFGQIAPPARRPSNTQKGSQNNLTVQRKAKGGLEYTEHETNNELHHLVGVNTTAPPPPTFAKAIGEFYAGKDESLGEAGLAFFKVPANQKHNVYTGFDNNDYTILNQGNVKLTNDVKSSEWVVEGHQGDGVSYAEMVDGIVTIFRERKKLKAAIDKIRGDDDTARVIFTPLNNILSFPEAQSSQSSTSEDKKKSQDEVLDDMFGDMMVMDNVDMNFMGQGVEESDDGDDGFEFIEDDEFFEYEKMADKSEGSAQLTMLYQSKSSLERIAELNAMKFTLGEKVSEKGVGFRKAARDYVGSDKGEISIASGSLFKRDKKVLSAGASLRRSLSPYSRVRMQDTFPLERSDIGTLCLMILNDAIAVTIGRVHAITGQTEQKNLLRYLPKSERQHYTKAILGQDLSTRDMATLRAWLLGEIANMSHTFNAAADLPALAALDMRHITDPMSKDEKDDFGALAATIGSNMHSGQDRRTFMNTVFGQNMALLRTHLTEVIGAYTQNGGTDMHTDTTGAAPRSKVVRSINFAGVSDTDVGGVFETRNEVPVSEDNLDDLKKAAKQLLGIAEKTD